MRISDWSSDVCSSDLLLHYGSEEQKQKWLPKMASGEVIGAIAMTEPGGGSDLQAVKTTAIRDGNEFVINGQKTRSEEHTSELQSLMRISYAVFCLKKKKQKNKIIIHTNNYPKV